MARNAASRKELSAAGLLGIVRRCFEAVADPVARRGGASLADCLVPDWETLYALATKDGVVAVAVNDTS